MAIRREVTISREDGLHARPAANLVRELRQYSSQVWITVDEKRVDAKSVLMVMSLAVKPGTHAVVEADGTDEVEALKTVVRFVGTEQDSPTGRES